MVYHLGMGVGKRKKVSKKAKAFFAFFSFSFSFFNCFVLLISLEMGKCFLFTFIRGKNSKVDAVFVCCNLSFVVSQYYLINFITL